jgi:hypothetical protein
MPHEVLVEPVAPLLLQKSKGCDWCVAMQHDTRTLAGWQKALLEYSLLYCRGLPLLESFVALLMLPRLLSLQPR